MRISVILAALLATTFMFGCGEQADAVTVSKVQRVTDFDFTLNETSAVSIAVGPTDKNYFDITLNRSNIKTGYSVLSKSKNDSSISIEANWDGKNYVQSSKHKTDTSVYIVTIDKVNKSAVIEIGATLVNPKTGEHIKLDSSKITITGSDFVNLTKE